MKDLSEDDYPGAAARAEDVGRLADEYHRAFSILRDACRKGSRVSYLPARFCALHAIELYLNAFLRQTLPAEDIRSRNHAFAEKARQAREQGLSLSSRRMKCLERVSVQRDYLRYRYDPDAPPSLEQINSLERTLSEIADAVHAAVKWKRAPEGALHDGQGAAVTPPASPSPPA